jgi:dipeptidyl aminopeptidase/acylaminoacyl peptidase
MRPTLVVTFASLALAPTLAAQQGGAATAKRAFTPNDWYKVTTLSSPAVSPDGRLVAVTVTTVREGENKRHSEIWVVPAAGGTPRRYTSPSTESSNPRFSPDGKYLLFSSTRPGSRARTWGLRIDEPSGEAEEIDRYPAGSTPSDASFAVWSDASGFGFGGGPPETPERSDSARSDSARRDPFAGMQRMARPPFAAVTRPVDPKRVDGMHVGDMRYKANGQGFLPSAREARKYRPSQIWKQRFDGSKKQLVGDSTLYSRRGAAVSPDGRWVAFIADPALRPDSVVEAERDSLARLPYDAKRDEAPRNDGDVFVVSIDGGEPRRLTRANGTEGDLAWSPDGKRLAFIASPTRTKSQRIWVVDAAGGEPVNVLGTWQYEPQNMEWLPDGTIAYTASIGGSSATLTVNPTTKEIRTLVGGRRSLRGFAYDTARKVLAYVSTTVDQPTELYVANGDGSNERKVSAFNDKVNSEIAWSDAERFTFRSVGGLEIEGWLMKPFGYEAGKKYPLVLYIHGGPHSQYNEGWFDEFQNLAGAGMWVLYTNPRGSSGYGADFTYSTRGRWFAEDFQDLMKAVDVVAKRPDVDSTRMGVTGGSYGGVMTAWVTTQTNRFKAAQTDRMISNWWSWYGTSDAQGLTEFEFFGKPWDNPTLYDRL